MGSGRDREDRSINDTDISQSVHLEFRVNDAPLVPWQHSQTISWMEFRFDRVEEECLDSLISGDVGSGRNFVSKDLAKREGLSNLPDQLDTFAQRHEISEMGEILRVDDGVVERIARVDVCAALTKWMLKGYLDGESLFFGGGSTCGPQQNFEVSDTTQQKSLRSSPVDCLIAVYDALVLARTQVIGRSIDGSEDLVLEVIGRFRIPERRREVDISDSRVHIGKEW